MRNSSEKICGENRNIHFMLKIVFRKSCRLWGNVTKYCTAGYGRDG